jgi:Lrp/AsnC family transcriptional regulator for asnA, asnC and gidA
MKPVIKSVSPSIEDLDEIDRKIINYLQNNGRESFSKIGDEIGVPASTVRDRTKRLTDEGILRIIGVLNPLKSRQRVMANIAIKLNNGEHRAVAKEIARLDEVTYLIICAGRFDLLVEVICRNNAHLLDIISALQDMPQVQFLETSVYCSVVKEVFDNHYDCAYQGYTLSADIIKNLGEKQVNADRMYLSFSCKPVGSL